MYEIIADEEFSRVEIVDDFAKFNKSKPLIFSEKLSFYEEV